jgi:hypothetical protein
MAGSSKRGGAGLQTQELFLRNIRLPRLVFGAVALAVLATPAASDPSPGASTLNLAYTLSFWTIPFGHTNYDGTLTSNSYSASAHFETSGVVGFFWKSVIDATSSGGLGAHSIMPALYDSYSRDRDKPMQRVQVKFDSDQPVTFADPAYDMTQYPVSEVQKKGAVDPMSAVSAILTGVKADAANPCGAGVQVFDGRRRYDVLFTYLKDEPVQLGNKLFVGNAHLCQIHYNQIAGYKQKIIKAGRAIPPIFADFTEIPAPGTPTGHYVVAVKLWSTLSLGTVTVTLDSLRVDGATPARLSNRS